MVVRIHIRAAQGAEGAEMKLEKKVIRYKRELHELESGTKVSLLWNDMKFSIRKKPEVWKTATIQDVLSSQFTATYDDVDGNPLTFLFYDAAGVTWRPIEDE